mgnify:CR=1 FL=1
MPARRTPAAIFKTNFIEVTSPPNTHNAELSGDLVMEAQPQCKGRPAATGRELMRLVRDVDQDTHPLREPNPSESESPFLVRPF